MMFAHPYYFQPISITPDSPKTLIVENAELFRRIIFELIGQCRGDEGGFVISEDNKILDFAKQCVLISDLYRLDFVCRDVKAKIQKILEENARTDEEANHLVMEIEQYAEKISENFEYPLNYKMTIQPADIIKLLSFEIDEEGETPLERLVDYFEIYSNLLSRQLIITVNMKDMLSEKDYEYLCNDVSNRQINLLMVERHTHSFDDPDTRIIIDQDLCEI